MVFTPTRGPVDLRHLSQWWRWKPGACWKHPNGPEELDRQAPRPPGRARRPRGRRGVRRLGRRRAADRGRVGVRRARWARGRGVHLGRRGATRRQDHGEHLGRAGLPLAQHRRERLPAHRTGRQLPAQRLRALRHGRQRLGVDRRLVDRAATPTDADKPCCVPSNPRGGALEQSYDPAQPQFRDRRARWSRAARTCAPTPTACATDRPLGGRR